MGVKLNPRDPGPTVERKFDFCGDRTWTLHLLRSSCSSWAPITQDAGGPQHFPVSGLVRDPNPTQGSQNLLLFKSVVSVCCSVLREVKLQSIIIRQPQETPNTSQHTYLPGWGGVKICTNTIILKNLTSWFTGMLSRSKLLKLARTKPNKHLSEIARRASFETTL